MGNPIGGEAGAPASAPRSGGGDKSGESGLSLVSVTPVTTTWRRLMEVAGEGAPALSRAIGKLALAAVLHGLCLALLIPLSVALVQDTDWHRAGIWLAAMGGILGLSAALRWSAYNFEFHGGMIRITQQLRTELGYKLRSVPLEMIQREKSGATVHKLLTGVDNTMTAVLGVTNAILLAIVPPVVVGLALFGFDWRLGLISFLTFPLLGYFYYRRRPAFGRSARAVDAAHQDLHQQVLEYTQGLPVLRASGVSLRDHPVADEIDRLERLQSADTDLSTSATLFMSVTVQLGLLVSLAVGAWLVVTGETELAVFLAFLLILSRFGEPLSNLVLYTYMFDMLEQAVENIDSLRRVPDQVAIDPAAEPDRFDIILEGVSFGYQGSGGTVLRDVTARFPENQLSAIVGPSGQGKTTLLKLLQRFADPRAGRILIGGLDIRRIPPAKLASLISVVFQDVHLFGDTILNNIRMARPTAGEDEVIEAAQRAGCDAFIRALPNGYETRVGDNGATLSSGERQRISIARAFLKNSPIILLDEPTAALDTVNERLVQHALEHLVRGRTVIVISHRLSLVAGADRIFVLEEGRVSEQGDHTDLMAEGGRYSRMQAASAEEFSRCD